MLETTVSFVTEHPGFKQYIKYEYTFEHWMEADVFVKVKDFQKTLEERGFKIVSYTVVTIDKGFPS